MKKIGALILAALLLCGAALAEEWVFDTEWYYIQGYTGSEAHVEMPSWIDECPVEVLEEYILQENPTMETIVLSENMLDIRSNNFYGNPKLTGVTLPESLIVIGSGNFVMCDALTEVTVPSRVSYIGKGCFNDCASLVRVTFEGVCPVFGPECFEWNDLDVEICVPDDQIEAYRAALPGKNVQPSGKPAQVQEFPADESEYLVDGSVVTAYMGFDTRVDIPQVIEGEAITAIGEGAFPASAYITYVTVPEGVTEIGAYAFAGMVRLMHVTLPSTLKIIDEKAFEGFRGYSMTLPEGLESIGDKAFCDAWLEGTLVLPSTLTWISPDSFENCTGLTEIVVLCDPSVVPDALKESLEATNPYIEFISPAPAAQPVGAEGEPFLGVWSAQTIEMEGMTLDAAALGMTMVLTFHEDGTMVMDDGETEETGVWTVSDGAVVFGDFVLTLTGDGMLRMEEDGAVMLFAQGEATGGEMSEEEQLLALLALMEAMGGEEPEEPEGFTSYEDYLDKKFVCTTFTSSGFTMDASTLGTEYALYFRADGTCDFTMAGVEAKGLSWGLNSVSVGLQKTDAFVISYYGNVFNAIPTAEGFDLDFFGSMNLHFTLAE